MKFLPLLSKFRTDRDLNTFHPFTFAFMTSQELKEVLTAETIEHEIEEMCDVCVLCFNALAQQGVSIDPVALDRLLLEDISDTDVAVMLAKEELRKGRITSIIMIMRNCINFKGYNFELAMVETSKKILSRTGEMNHETGKWEKHKEQKNPYVPNYKNCLLVG